MIEDTALCSRCGSNRDPRQLGTDGEVYCVDTADPEGECERRIATRRRHAAASSAAAARRGGVTTSPQRRLADGCPKCGGQQFKARRSTARRAAIGTSIVTLGVFGAPAALAGKNQVQCVLCGTKYARKG